MEQEGRLAAIAESRSLTGVARIIQVVGVPAGLAVMAWAGLSLVSLGQDMAVVKSRINDLTASLNALYRSTDAERDFKLRDMHLEQVEHALEVVSRRLDRLENKGAP